MNIIQFIKKVLRFSKNSFKEVTENVSWPSWASLQQYTIIVIAGSLVISLLVWVMDISSNQAMKIIYSIFVSK